MKAREILEKAFKDSTSSNNITFQPKFIDQALTALRTLLVEELEKLRAEPNDFEDEIPTYNLALDHAIKKIEEELG